MIFREFPTLKENDLLLDNIIMLVLFNNVQIIFSYPILAAFSTDHSPLTLYLYLFTEFQEGEDFRNLISL